MVLIPRIELGTSPLPRVRSTNWAISAIIWQVKRMEKSGADTQNRTGDLTLTKGALYQLSHISKFKPGNDLLSHSECYTTIGTASFHFCVRNGYRWDQSVMVTGQSRLKIYQALLSLLLSVLLYLVLSRTTSKRLKPFGCCIVKTLG